MKHRFEIAYDKDGIELKKNPFGIFRLWSALTGGDGAATIQKARWSEIKSVHVFKTDAVTFDVICMGFLLKSGESFEISEHTGNWENFVEKLPEHLAGCREFHEWFMEVAFPAFETNLTQIY